MASLATFLARVIGSVLKLAPKEFRDRFGAEVEDGMAGALALESVVQSSVFGWKSNGPAAVVIVAIGLLAVAVIAALVPAARATRIDPAITLRAE